ncbi:MAG: ATP synthase subunit I [Gammaproteobacteria bacterium]|nr:ATP synthase subunit I [Gammaproteobacteria bacterium]
MSAAKNTARHQLPMRLVRTQALVAIVVSCLWLIFAGAEPALAAAFGGLISVVTNLYFAIRSFSLGPGATPQQRMQALARAEVIKLLLAAIMFALAAKYFSEHFVVLLSAWFATTAVYAFALRWRY